MSFLPQRKKSAEEIAKLRESLGVPGSPGAAEPDPETPPPPAPEADVIIPSHHEAAVVHETPPEPEEPARPLPAPASFAPHETHSLKRSERETRPPETQSLPEPETARKPKVVKSLRKSERGPISVATHAAEPQRDSKLPFHRHSDREIAEIRRREALAGMAPPPNPRLAVAHPALIIPGYLLAVAGASCFFFYQFTVQATAVCAGAALLIAAFIFLKKPISRHHAAFIAMIALLVIVFGALHFFPQLRHAT